MTKKSLCSEINRNSQKKPQNKIELEGNEGNFCLENITKIEREQWI